VTSSVAFSVRYSPQRVIADLPNLSAGEISPAALLERVDLLRLDATRCLDPHRQAELGQFLTPTPVARLMASLFQAPGPVFRFLDAGAGVGSLSAALVAELCGRPARPEHIEVTAFEIDAQMVEYLRETLALCKTTCAAAGVTFESTIRDKDFVRDGVYMLIRDKGSYIAAGPKLEFDGAILNPPYKKINTGSDTRQLLRRVGMETSNLYTAFVAVAGMLLVPGGELVAITPRSFCSGSYFRPFREWLLSDLAVTRFHVFESRTSAFRDDGVLQENVVYRAIRGVAQPDSVTVSASSDPLDDALTQRAVPIASLVRPDDPDRVIHLVADEMGQWVAERMGRFTHSLDDLGITVSTGRVVDFRAKDYLRIEMEESPDSGIMPMVPLIYPGHLEGWGVAWPKPAGRKPNALAIDSYTGPQTVPGGVYVLTKRFSAKEERRRVVAAIYDPEQVGWCGPVGFENHLNYYHQEGNGLPSTLADGLAAFLNSTLVDQFFRQFNGHTQVNAGDLRSLRYPDRAALDHLGATVGETLAASGGVLDQHALDELLDQELFGMAESGPGNVNPVVAKRRIDEALDVLNALGMPRAQRQARSALTLLAILDVRPDTPWSEARARSIGITPSMAWMRVHYGKDYKWGSRETVRRQSVHQFEQAGLIVMNPDKALAVNSPDYVYQVEPATLDLVRSYGTKDWQPNLEVYLTSRQARADLHAREREIQRIPLRMPDGEELSISSGGQNELIEKIVHEFCPRFTRGAHLLYLGDAHNKWLVTKHEELAELGIKFDEHGKMPDLIVFDREKGWLVVIEAVISHGPVDQKRKNELESLFAGSTAGIVYVTAFMDGKALKKYIGGIAWHTEVWVADTPDHLLHFNGERFLGPY
jgi:adenine-specific DNA-methyltransferase